MSKPVITFDSKKAPGSVVVRKDGLGVAMIVVNRGKDTEHIKHNDRFVLFIDDQAYKGMRSIKPGTYQEVKQQVIELFEKESGVKK